MNLKMIFAATVLAAMTMSSCSSDTPVDATENIARGETTYATFNLSLKTTGSRANGDDNADEREQTVSKMHLYIFGGGILEVDHAITDSYTFGNKVGPVQLTTGEKVVYAVAGDLKVNDAEFTAVAEGTEGAQPTRLSTFEKILFDALSEDIANENNFLMAGSEKVTVTKSTEDKPCEVTVSITRAATKTQLKYGNPDVTVRPTINAKFSDAKFVMMQCAETMWLTPGNYTQASKVNNKGTYSGYTEVPNTVDEDLFCDAVTDFSENLDNSLYTGEAYNENPVTGNTTFALVRLKATPTKICTNYTKATNTYTYGNTTGTNGTFYVITKPDPKTGSYIFASDNDYNILYFASQSTANSVKGTQGLGLGSEWKVETYTNGYVYYRVNLMTNPDATDLKEKYCALRNHFYKITVTDIKALGAPNAPGVVPTDPDQPLEADAWLDATITAEPWVAVDMNNTTLQ